MSVFAFVVGWRVRVLEWRRAPGNAVMHVTSCKNQYLGKHALRIMLRIEAADTDKTCCVLIYTVWYLD